jgi:phosphate:Na+ symporter
MWRAATAALKGRDAAALDAVAAMDDGVDALHGEIAGFLGLIQKQELTAGESRDLLALLGAANYVENAADVVETDLVALGRTMVERDLRASETMRLALDELGRAVEESLRDALRALVEEDAAPAAAVLARAADVDQRVDHVLRHQASKLAPDDPRRLDIFRVEMGLVDGLKLMYTLAARVARLVLEAEGKGVAEERPARPPETGGAA